MTRRYAMLTYQKVCCTTYDSSHLIFSIFEMSPVLWLRTAECNAKICIVSSGWEVVNSAKPQPSAEAASSDIGHRVCIYLSVCMDTSIYIYIQHHSTGGCGNYVHVWIFPEMVPPHHPLLKLIAVIQEDVGAMYMYGCLPENRCVGTVFFIT